MVITGGARGIGYGIAKCFVRRGDAVVVADADGEAASRAAGTLNQIRSTGCIGLCCDVADRTQVENTINEIVSGLGKTDVLVNNAMLEFALLLTP